MAKAQSRQVTKELAIKRACLHYFNRVLYEQGTISERERNKVSLMIENWTGIKK